MYPYHLSPGLKERFGTSGLPIPVSSIPGFDGMMHNGLRSATHTFHVKLTSRTVPNFGQRIVQP